MNTSTIVKSLKTLEASAESIDNGSPHQMPAAFAPGDIYWQGDIGLLMLSELPSNAVKRAKPWGGDLQLAEGNTRGSRHCIPHRFENVTHVYEAPTDSILDGSVLDVRKPIDLVHPEHGDHIGYPAGVYRVRYQQNALRERVID